MKWLVSVGVLAGLCAGCAQPKPTSVKEGNAAKAYGEPGGQPVAPKAKELPQVELESTVGGFWVSLPRAWLGTDLTDEAIEAFVQRISKVDPKVGSNVRKQATDLMKVGGTLLAFDGRPSRIKYGFGDFLLGSKAAKTPKEFENLKNNAKRFASTTPTEKTYKTPVGQVTWIRCLQYAASPKGEKFNVAHHFYILERPKAYYAFKCSTLAERETEMSKEFQAMFESLAFTE